MVATAALFALVILGVRLSQGPILLPWLGKLVEAAVNEQGELATVEVGETAFSLGRGGLPSGISFRELRLIDRDGDLLVSVPEAHARFRITDLLTGKVSPTEITIVRPQAEMIRAEDGRIRLGLGVGLDLGTTGVADQLPDDVPERPGPDLIATVIDGLAGDVPLSPTLAQLQVARVLDAQITYIDALSGRRWRTDRTDATIERDAHGLSGVVDAALTDASDDVTTLGILIDRPTGTGQTEVRLSFDALQPDDLAEQLAGTGWIRRVDAALTGRLRMILARDGTLRALDGELTAENGRVLNPDGPAWPFARIGLDYALGKTPRQMEITALDVDAPALRTRLAGHVTVAGIDPLVPEDIVVDLRADGLALDLPEVFAGPLAFDAAGLVARVDPATGTLELAEARLSAGQMQLSARGTLIDAPEGLRADLHLTGADIAVEQITAHWPPDAAVNARRWIAANIVDGVIPQMSAEVHVGAGDPKLSMAFTFRDLVARYLGDMTSIDAARGRAQLTWNDIWMEIDSARIARPGSGPIALDGSRVTVRDFWGEVTPADIEIRADGPTASILGLIDEPPLSLVGKLGLDPSGVSGRSEIVARLEFPLLDDLLVEQIDLQADARLASVGVPLDFAGLPEARLTSDDLVLSGTAEGMQLSGDAVIAGQPVRLGWSEDFRDATAGRTVELDGTLTPEGLRALGHDIAAFRTGRIGVSATLEQRGGRTSAVVDADLGAAGLEVAPLRWSKPRGDAGRLKVEAEVGAADGAIALRSIDLSAGGLRATGTARLDGRGQLAAAELPVLRLEGRADLSAQIGRADDGVLTVGLEGQFLDLSTYLADPPSEAPAEQAPIRIDVDLERLRLTPKLQLSPARGLLVRSAGGEIDLSIDGAVGRGARFAGTYSRSASVPGQMRITAPQAGEFLSGLDLFGGGSGGELVLDAAFAPGEATDITGAAKISGMTVRGASTFGSILEQGGVSDAADAVQQGGLTFPSIDIPFQYRDGVLSLDSAIARSPAIALKVSGDVDETANTVSLYGVISPAYGLTGALDRIPLIGKVLSGGRGEGILAMTFNVTGTLDAPRFEVNPLSLLTPGILRDVFERGASTPSARFMDGLAGPQ